MRGWAAVALAGSLFAGCTAETARTTELCDAPSTLATLPAELSETSGIAGSRQYPGVLWTHNDSGGEPVVYALDEGGRILGRVRVAGARNRDWEDIALGPCPDGTCLYIADTGDTRLRRDDAAIYRIPEPAPDDSVSRPAERFALRFPDGPRDVEAVYVLPDTTLYLVGKGRNHPIALYRATPPFGDTVELDEIQRFGTGAAPLAEQVTGAAVTPDGRWVAIRTYTSLRFYHPDHDGRLTRALDGAVVDLQPLAEPQGEAVEMMDDGTVYLTSEAGVAGVPATLSRLRCRLDGESRGR